MARQRTHERLPAPPTQAAADLRAIFGSGRPLDAGTRAEMRATFGHDFSRVRVHTGAAADQSARLLHARAWTLGNDIVFAAGRYAPHTAAGRRLLAHELAHTIQQAGAAPGPRAMTTPGDAAEQGATRASAAIARGEPAGPLAAAPLAIAREEETATPPATTPVATADPPSDAAATKPPAKTLSGASWHDQFPTSTSIDDLESGFAAKVKLFIAALTAAGATTTINATKRPAERAYLMHWAWKIAKDGYDASKVPAKEGVNIEWWHGDAAKSKAAAQEMCDKYEINNLQVAPSLTSRHIEGKAIDMEVSWSETLKIATADGKTQEITSTPRDSTNADLIAVAKGYGVIHFTEVEKDKIHWSTDGK